MSEFPCAIPPPLPNASYPPIARGTAAAAEAAADSQLAAKVKAAQEMAPFGRHPKQKAPINASQYKNAMAKEIAAAGALDFRWPFWLGLGLGGVAVVVLIAKR